MPTECPRCGTNRIHADPIEQDGELGEQHLECRECKFEWYETWVCARWRSADDESKEYDPGEIPNHFMRRRKANGEKV